MPRREFTEFHVGQKVRILDDRRNWWQPEDELEIAAVDNHGFKRGVGHSQSLTMRDGHIYSGWWFDPKLPCHFSPDREPPRTADQQPRDQGS